MTVVTDPHRDGRWLPGTDIWEQAAEIQEALTEQARHRSASIPDLIVAATGRARGLEIPHYGRDFETIARCNTHTIHRAVRQ